MTYNGRIAHKLRRGDAVLIARLAAGDTIAEAAEAAGVGQRTVYRRLDDATFRRDVSRARADVLAHAVGRLAAEATRSVDVLCELRDNPDVPASVRCRAAREVLRLGRELREAAEIEERLAALEAALDAR